MPERAFTVSTVELDLAPVAATFGRRLHDAGVPVTSERAARFAQALTVVRPVSRRRLYWTARATLVTDAAQVEAFDAVFASVFGGHDRAPVDVPEDARSVPAPPDPRAAEEHPRTTAGGTVPHPLAGVAAAGPPSGEDGAHEERDVPIPVAASDDEVLRAKRFDALEADELARVYRLMARLRVATPTRRTRRAERDRRGEHMDMRRTLRGSLRTAGDPIRLARRRRRVVRRRLVLLCDISGSMEPYSRAYLQFLTSAAGSGRDAEAFVFATRLTRVTRALGGPAPERAIAEAATAAPDWAGGTRIGEALRAFNDRHGRRGLARGAVVVILSDGWERDAPEVVGAEMERLRRLAHRIVWVNPRSGGRAFEPLAGGMAAALPYCDDLLPGHSLAALEAVADAITRT